MMQSIRTLPQVLLHKELIVCKLLSRLQIKARLSLEPILRYAMQMLNYFCRVWNINTYHYQLKNATLAYYLSFNFGQFGRLIALRILLCPVCQDFMLNMIKYSIVESRFCLIMFYLLRMQFKTPSLQICSYFCEVCFTMYEMQNFKFILADWLQLYLEIYLRTSSRKFWLPFFPL